MPITLTNSAAVALTLPSELCWTDEFQWSPVSQQLDISVGGNSIIQESAQLAAMPITLSTAEGGDWMTRSQVETLNAWAAIPNASYTLVLNDSRTFSVAFRRISSTNGSQSGSAAPVIAKPVVETNTPSDADPFTVTINLMTL